MPWVSTAFCQVYKWSSPQVHLHTSPGEAEADLVVVSGDEELAGLGLYLLILLQSDDCCHCGEHWDICRQTDRQTGMAWRVNYEVERQWDKKQVNYTQEEKRRAALGGKNPRRSAV